MVRSERRSHILTSRQVAEVLGISKKTLGRMIADGRIPEPARNPSNNWRFWTAQDVEEIRRLLEEKR